jgi:hypothetical protein
VQCANAYRAKAQALTAMSIGGNSVALKSIHSFEVPNYGRSASDQGWETIGVEHIATWKSALAFLKIRTLKLPNCTISIEADWSPILKKHEQHYAVMQRIKQGFKDEEDAKLILSGFPTRKAKISLSADVTGEHRDLAPSAIQSYLHDCFLMLNISAPGCCDFYRASLTRNNSPTDISLSNIHFEIGLLGSFEKSWPQIQVLPLNNVIEWFDSIRMGASQLPENPMEKVLFALLHISKLDISPMVVIWLFYAFESLLQTKTGENFSSMVRRLISLLGLNEKQSKILRSKFRTLYEIRSAIVHGGFEISHPMHDEVLDKRVSENFERISQAADYGLTALLAAIQSTIVRGWKYPNFTESMNGVPVAP